MRVRSRRGASPGPWALWAKALWTKALWTKALWVGALWAGCIAGCSADPAPGAGDRGAAVDRGADGPHAATDAAGADGGVVDAAPRPYPDPGAWGPNHGPGGPATAFAPEALQRFCAVIDVGPDDPSKHRNLVTMYDGYLAMPWAPEYGLTGGLSFFDVRDPCAPRQVGHGTTDLMRETHTLGFSSIGGRFAVTMYTKRFREGGLLFWDVSDPTAPAVVSALALPGFRYPDAYARIVFAAFWQGPYVYAAGADNGIYVVDAHDPRDPKLVHQHLFEPTLRAGQVHAIGDLLVVTSAEGARTALLDISEPDLIQPIPGGDFVSTDGEGHPREAYFTNFANGYIFYARKDSGGGLVVWDVRDPTRPVYAGDRRSDGNGGYVFVKGDRAYVGESRFAAVYDVSDLSDIRELARLHMPGDLDTATPIGNVVVLAVDDKAEDVDGDGVADGTLVVPFDPEPDTTPPRVTWVYPADGATLTPTSRIGLSFDEMVDVKSAWEGSVRLYRADRPPALGRVDGFVSAQENLVNFWPQAPLEPGVRYTLEVPAGGISDFNGNPVAVPFTAHYQVAGTPR